MEGNVAYIVTSSDRLIRVDLKSGEWLEFSTTARDWVPVPIGGLKGWETDPREEGVFRSFSLESALNEWKTRSPRKK